MRFDDDDVLIFEFKTAWRKEVGRVSSVPSGTQNSIRSTHFSGALSVKNSASILNVHDSYQQTNNASSFHA
eukprot:scaffold12330_cov83-Skeletonema_marinoi.AAC.25